MNELPLKERTAIELRYLGKKQSEIAEVIQVSINTVEGWFESNGKLFSIAEDYYRSMNAKRQKDLEDKISLSDEEIFITTTNIARSVAKGMQKQKRHLVDKKGNPVADDNGNPIYVEVEAKSEFSVRDLVDVWKMQRIMKGLPTNYEKQDIQTSTASLDRIKQDLGLTDDDFSDEKMKETQLRINKYLDESGLDN